MSTWNYYRGNTKDDMTLPIGGFNPMAKEHVLDKILELKQMDAEGIIQDALDHLNENLNEDKREFKVVLNLSDDLKGGWTNRYVSDYDCKF